MTAIVELFRFVEGALTYTQTRAPYSITYNSETYTPYAIGRSSIESKNELQRANVDLTIDITNPLALKYLSAPVDSVVTLTIFRQENASTSVFWKGRLSAVNASGDKVKLTFESVFTSLRRPGLRARFQKGCRHPLYGRGCNLDPEDFAFETTTDSVSGLEVVVDSVDSQPDNTYRGGMIRGPDNTLRYIMKQIGTTLTLARPFKSLSDAVAADAPTPVDIKIYPGCPHVLAYCDSYFGNKDNYGGFPWIATNGRNPYAGISIAN